MEITEEMKKAVFAEHFAKSKKKATATLKKQNHFSKMSKIRWAKNK